MAHTYAHLPPNTVHACARLTLVCAHASNHGSGPGWTSKGGKDRPIPDPMPPGSTPHSPQKCHVPASHGGSYCPPEEAWASACVPRRRSAEKSGKNMGPSVARRARGTVVSHGVRHEDDPWGGHEQRDGRRAAMRTMSASQGFVFREVFREESFWSKEIDAEGKARRKIWPNIIRGRGGPTTPPPKWGPVVKRSPGRQPRSDSYHEHQRQAVTAGSGGWCCFESLIHPINMTAHPQQRRHSSALRTPPPASRPRRLPSTDRTPRRATRRPIATHAPPMSAGHVLAPAAPLPRVVQKGLWGGGGVWNPKVCVPKIAQINISLCKFHFFPP